MELNIGGRQLNWSQDDLEKTSGVSNKTIFNMENERKNPQARTLRDIFEAFEKEGIEFLNGDGLGVRLRGGGEEWKI